MGFGKFLIGIILVSLGVITLWAYFGSIPLIDPSIVTFVIGLVLAFAGLYLIFSNRN